MWDLISNPFQPGLERALIPLAVFIASFLGSWHCVGMCGGLIAVAAPTQRAVVLYHVGRLLGYATLGFLAGLLGEKTLAATTRGVLPWIAALSLGLAFVFMGLFAWRGPGQRKSPPSFLNFYSRIWGKILKAPPGSTQAFPVGLMSVLLPCGWLYTFVLGAVATQSALYGSLFLFAFWLGSVPGLSLTPLFFRKLFNPLSRRMPKMAAVFLILIGLFTLGWKISPLLGGAAQSFHSSHCSHK